MKQESEPKPLFKVTLMRHEKTAYTGVYPDITNEGLKRGEETGRRIKEERLDDEDELYLLSSPSERAVGTLDIVTKSAGISAEKNTIDQLRPTDVHNAEEAQKKFSSFGGVQEEIAKAHHTDDFFETRPDVLEPHSQKKKRLYRALEYFIRYVEKRENDPRIPHAIAVSHGEILNHLIDDVFGVETIGRYNTPSYGEVVYIDAYTTGDRDSVRLKIKYEGNEKEVLFNRKSRSIEQ